jgi:hypothetical protein
MNTISRPKAAAVAVTALGLCLGSVGTALADPQAGPNDATVSGSDTTQYASTFLFEGTVAGDGGYNTGKTNRVYSFDATADGKGRQSYTNNDAASPIFDPYISYRQGTKPVIRVNGSGNGIKSLYQAPYTDLPYNASAATPSLVSFTRSSRLPTCAENTNAVTAGTGGLHSYRMGTEALAMGVRTVAAGGTNAPAGLTPVQVLKIYQGQYLTWGDIPGYSGPAPSATIKPLLIQSGSGTRGVFDADMKAANGNIVPTYSNPNIETVQENDWSGIANSSSPINALVAFSGARITLLNSSYFGSGLANGQNYVTQIVGVAPGETQASASYLNNRPVFFTLRQNDVTVNKPFQPGGTKNMAQELFTGAGNMLQSPIFGANIQAAGFTPSYFDTGAPGSGTSCT